MTGLQTTRLLGSLAPLLAGCGADIRLEYPALLALALPALIALAWGARRESGAGLGYTRVADVLAVGGGVRARLRHVPAVTRTAALLLTVVAVARPQAVRTDERTVEGMDLFLALDMSGSMASIDLTMHEAGTWQAQRRREPPNRFEHAIRTLKDFVADRRTDRIGMVVFARDAYLQFPLTLDYQTVQTLLDGLRLEMIDPSATAIGNALGVAVRGLLDSDATSRAIVLITDGKQQGGNIAPMEAAELAAEEGIRIFTILVGREGTTLVPTNRVQPNGFRRYAEQNNPVDPDLLRRIADRTGGAFYRSENPAELDRDLNAILDELEKTRVVDIASVHRTEIFHVPLLLALALFVLDAVLRWGLLRRIP